MAYPQYFIHFEDDLENKEYICQLCFYIKGTLRAVEKDKIRFPMIIKQKLGRNIVAQPAQRPVAKLSSEEYLQLYQKVFDIFVQRVNKQSTK